MLSGSWGVLGWLKIWDSRVDGIELDSIYTTESTLPALLLGCICLNLELETRTWAVQLTSAPIITDLWLMTTGKAQRATQKEQF